MCENDKLDVIIKLLEEIKNYVKYNNVTTVSISEKAIEYIQTQGESGRKIIPDKAIYKR